MILKVFQKVLYDCKQALQKDALRAVVTGHPAPSASGRQAAFIAGPENGKRLPRFVSAQPVPSPACAAGKIPLRAGRATVAPSSEARP